MIIHKFLGGFFLFGLLVLQTAAQVDAVSKEAGTGELYRLVGRWVGEGTSDGEKVRDEMRCEWIHGNRFLKLHYRATDGDDYSGEGYLRYNPERKLYEYWEFNNGRWPVRQWTGNWVKDRFVFSEDRKDLRIQLTMEFVSADSIKMSENYVRGDKLELFVSLTFRRDTKASPR